MSPLPCALLLTLLLLLLEDDVIDVDTKVVFTPPQDDDRLDFGTAIIPVIGGDDEEEEEVAELLFIPPTDNDDAVVKDQGRITLMHDREFKSHIRSVPSSEPLANNTFVVVPLGDDDIKLDGSSIANDVTALVCPFNSDV